MRDISLDENFDIEGADKPKYRVENGEYIWDFTSSIPMMAKYIMSEDFPRFLEDHPEMNPKLDLSD